MTDQTAIDVAEKAADDFATDLHKDIRGAMELLLDGAFRRIDTHSDARPDLGRKLIVGAIVEALHDWDLGSPDGAQG